jgi:type II secretory pathway pseudopilin PulG
MSPRHARRRSSQAGYSLVALMVAVTVMMVMMGAAVPSWRYLMKNDREEELIFRGGEIADAIGRYQKKNANALPPSLDVLVKGKFLRKAYKDPMTKDGKWRFIRQGETLGATPATGLPGGAPNAPTTTTTTLPARPGGNSPGGTTTVGGTLGTILGVASTSTEKSLRIFNGRTKYSEWLFIPGQPRNVGLQAGPALIGPGSARPSPAATPRTR